MRYNRMRQEYDWSKYKEGLRLLSLNKEEEQNLIKLLECSYDMAMNLEVQELLNRRSILQTLIEKYSEMLKKECYELFYVLGNMEDNYRFVISEKRKGKLNE